MDIKIDKHTALVFDLDDTLYNELEFLKSAYWEICFNLKPKDVYTLFNFVFSLYRNGKNPFLYLSETFCVPIEQLLNTYRTHTPKIKPFPGVLNVIKEVKKKNGKLGIITDGRIITQSNKLKSLGIWEDIDCCIISESIGSEKPNLKNFKLVEEDLKLNTYYYFGDNFKKDFIAPLVLGWHTVGVMDNGMNIHPNSCDFQLNVPECLIRSFEEVSII